MDPLCYNQHCDTRAFYIKTAQQSIFAWQHIPKSKCIRDKVILICPAIGYEYKHAYRSLRRLADYLCTQGFFVFRFDYSGMGNSSGSALSDDSLQNWIDDIKTLSDSVAAEFPDFKQCLLGFRLGGTLATLVANKHIIDSLVLWEPIIKGRPYIRELEAISRLSVAEGSKTKDYLETAGFALQKIVAEKIKKIDLRKDAQISPETKILQLARDDKPVDDNFVTQLREQGIDIHLHSAAGYADMMAEPHETKTPVAAIKYISQWLQQRSEEIEQTTPIYLTGDPTLHIGHGDNKIQEQPLFFGTDKTLFGILTKPVKENNKSSHCIILVNSGSVHHAGPSSIYTLISRALAALGFLVFRIDLENIGDSHIVDPDMENHPYQPNAVANINTAIEFIKQHTAVDNFIISGLCSGAHTAFHAGLELTEHNISKILMINPLTFYWEPNMSLETPNTLRIYHDQAYYKQTIYSLEKWKKFFTGRANVGYISKFIFQRSVELLQKLLRDTYSLIMGEHTLLAQDLMKIHQNGTTVGFIFASTDPGLDIIKSQASRTLNKGIKENWIGIHIIDDADHTFTKKASRDSLLSMLKKDFEKLL